MDDLYANAWDEPSQPPLSDFKPSTSSSKSWLSPKLPDAHEEADLAAPSWSTGAGIGWNEPSDSAGFSWGQADTDLAWGASSYDNIPIGKSVATGEEDVLAADPPVVQEEPPPSPASPSPESSPEVREPSPPPPVQEVLATAVPFADAEVLSPPAEHDAFGTFESALAPTEDATLALEENVLNTDAWGSAWASELEQKEAEEAERVDEWEAARQRKAQQDRKIPPSVMAAMLRDCEQFCEEAWPEPKSPDAKDKDEWKNNWRRGIEGVEGLEALVNTFLPPLSLQPPVQFGKAATAKRMAMSVRLTKNMAMSKRSPMAHYLTAKGSTAWEVAVKERKEVIGDDMPAGWRILEKESAGDAAAGTIKEKKPAGRLFSFWGRRESSTTSAHTRSSSQSDARDETSSRSPVVENIGHSRRPSQDSVRSLASGSADKSAPPTRHSSSSPAPSANASTSSLPAAPARSTSYADAPEPQVDTNNAQAPSAVSRFWDRFSRRRSTMGSGSPRNSLALSSDDLEFLAEIPSANDGEDDEEATLKAFESVFNSKPQPSVLPAPLPAPLPPPPSVNTAVRSVAGNVMASLHSPMDSLDSSLGLLDSSAFTAAPAAVVSISNAAPLQPVTAIPVLQPSRPATPPVGLSRRDTRSASPSPLSVERKAIPVQPFFLPSPPSSRSHTPVPAARSALSEPARSQTPPVTQEAVQRASSSKLPPPLLPPPWAPTPTSTSFSVAGGTANPPDTPTSALPLAELYPDAYQAQANKSVASRPASRARMAASLIPPPPTSSQSSGALPPILAPPPAPSRQPSVLPPFNPPPAASRQSTSTPSPFVPSKPFASAKPSALPLASSTDDDDEEFSDFLSSATVPTSSKPLVRSISTSSRSSTPNKTPPSSVGRSGGRAPALAHLRIGSSSRASASGTSALPAKLALLDDGDDFSDFQASPATGQPPSSKPYSDDPFSDFRSFASSQPLRPQPPSSQSTSSFDAVANDSATSDRTFLTPKKDPGFDFLNSYTSSLRTPSPPRPLSKAPPVSSTSSYASAPDSKSVADASMTRVSKAASHLHTLNLMEKAASRPGRWPAPPSPLPHAIPGPINPFSAASVDLLGDDGSPQRPSVTTSHSSPAWMNPFQPASSTNGGSGMGTVQILPPPPLSQSQSLQSTSLGSLQRMGSPPTASHSGTTPAVTPAPAQSTSKTTGLSAQDLMFFEGL